MSDTRVPLVYIEGLGRSGSTLLDMLLGADPRLHSCGEVIWTWSALERHAPDWECTCGKPFSRCRFWSDVRASMPRGYANASDMAEINRQVYRTKHLPHWLSSASAALPRLPVGYQQDSVDLYRAVFEASRRIRPTVSALIDSSKNLSYLAMLARHPEAFDLRVIHLVRDPCAVAYSYSRPWKSRPNESPPMPPHDPRKVALAWNVSRLAGLVFDRKSAVPSMEFSYEELCENPYSVLSRAKQFIFGGDEMVDLSGSGECRPEYHLMFGNGSRYTPTRLGDLAADERWRTELSPRKKIAVRLLSFPMSQRRPRPLPNAAPSEGVTSSKT